MVVLLLLGFCGLGLLCERVRHMSAFSVRLFEEAISIGDVTAKWDEIESIHHPTEAIGVAFRVKLRDGRRLAVYSGVENVQQLEQLIETKLDGARTEEP